MHRALALIALLAWGGALRAVEVLGFDVGTLTGAGWGLSGLSLNWSLADRRLVLKLEALDLPEPVGRITAVRVSCGRIDFDPGALTCADGLLEADHALLREGVRGLSLRYAVDRGEVLFEQLELPLGAGRVVLGGRAGRQNWSADLRIEGAPLSAVQSGLESVGFLNWPLGARGSVDGDIRIEQHAPGASTFSARLTARGIRFADQSGSVEGEGIGLSLTAQASLNRDTVDFAADGRWMAGAAYVDPVLIETRSDRALSFRLVGRKTPEGLTIRSLDLADPGAGKLSAQGSVPAGNWRLASGHIDVELTDLGGAYAIYLQPFGVGTLMGDLELGGRASGRVEAVAGEVEAVRLRSEGSRIGDALARFDLQDVSIDLDWHRDATGRNRLAWAAGSFYKIPLGPVEVAAQTSGRALELLQPVILPLLGGTLHLDRLSGEDFLSPVAPWRLDGRVTGISMRRLSEALEWPPLEGDLSGMVPSAVYRDRILTIGGALLIRAFDGTTTMTGLRVERPLGLIPRLTADVDIRALDLLALTQTFEFGRIEGRLDGRIQDLELENWGPVRFDARLATPEGDRSRRRISQRAVANLSSIGGGSNATAVLSKGFMGLFKEFSYRRLGVRCRLMNGVCEMEGVSAAPRGYYLVEGGGLPRIDVIGYERRVDWKELVARLRSATRSSGPVIQ